MARTPIHGFELESHLGNGGEKPVMIQNERGLPFGVVHENQMTAKRVQLRGRDMKLWW